MGFNEPTKPGESLSVITLPSSDYWKIFSENERNLLLKVGKHGHQHEYHLSFLRQEIKCTQAEEIKARKLSLTFTSLFLCICC